MKVILVGALGRMGAQVAAALARHHHEVAVSVDIGYETSGNGCYRSVTEVTERADVIVDFSYHGITPAVVGYAAEKGIPAVIATTGHNEEERCAIQRAAEKAAIFYSGNMSVGIATLCEAVRRVVAAFPEADVEIVETHHNRKLDAPSGTALMLFDAVREERPEATPLCGRSGQAKRTANEVGVSSLRMGNIVGVHEVMIATDHERITLKHEAFDRSLFADGAVRAAEFLASRQPGLYTMKELLKG
ncbi:MAG: 4-hydroxy-tetrahydrodipicolinate reductase [Ruminococcaceae bacterium]|nr:4-hydroxy-tetrahydrodipicolinate reductase [Oscillospiraceae bacterium]